MDKAALHLLFSFLDHSRITGLNEVRIDALSRMYLAFNDLICTLAVNDYEDRRKIARRINSIYRGLDRSSIVGLLRMYRLTKEVAMAVYGPKDEECSALYYELLDGQLEHLSPAEEIAAMQCIVYEIGNIAGNNTEFDFYPWFQERCREWVAGLDESGCWPGLPVETALQRLQLLKDNSCVFRDKALDAEVLRAYDHYRSGLILPERTTAEDLPLLGAWYDLLRIPGLVEYEPALLHRIAQMLEEFAAATEVRSDVWYFAMSYAAVQGCADVVEAAEREMMQQTA